MVLGRKKAGTAPLIRDRLSQWHGQLAQYRVVELPGHTAGEMYPCCSASGGTEHEQRHSFGLPIGPDG